MADFPYTPNPPNIGRFLDHIQVAGVPSKVTNQHLKSVGFKSSNDGYIIAVLKDLQFLDSSGSPTEKWKAYKDKSKAKHVLGETMKKTYSDLFSIYPDAYRKDDEALHNYFASKTGLAKPTVDRMVRTFKLLCDKAEFETVSSSTPPVSVATQEKKPGVTTATAPPPAVKATTVPTININVELHLPPTDDASVYEKLFAAMKKHLFS